MKFSFPSGFEAPVPTPAVDNHPSAHNHLRDVASYATMDVKAVANLGPFDHHPFKPWCQVNTLLTWPKKDSHLRKVVMGLSWPHPPAITVNGCTPKDTYLGVAQKMYQPSAQDFINFTTQEGHNSLLYCCDVARTYRQLPLDLGDWPLVWRVITSLTSASYSA